MQNNMITSEQQYIVLDEQAGEMIKSHSAEVMNAVRDEAFRDFQRLGFPLTHTRLSAATFPT